MRMYLNPEGVTLFDPPCCFFIMSPLQGFSYIE